MEKLFEILYWNGKFNQWMPISGPFKTTRHKAIKILKAEQDEFPNDQYKLVEIINNSYVFVAK